MVGKPNEINISVGGVNTCALLDTGSTVSTISEEYYRQYCSHCNIIAVNVLLDIECADGPSMPYLGCIKMDLNMDIRTSVFLVTPTSNYSCRVPVLLGTNALVPITQVCSRSVENSIFKNVTCTRHGISRSGVYNFVRGTWYVTQDG